MKQLFSKKFMRDNCGCYTLEELEGCSFMSADKITLELIVNSEIPPKDKFWFVCRKAATKKENQRIVIDAAKSVLVVFEDKYPNDDRVRKCIEGAEAYLEGRITVGELRVLKRAAYAAYAAAADAADAAYAAAAAAYADAADAAAAAAAYADAAYAAYAAYAADAAADADAADADALQTQLLDILKSYIK